MRFPFTLVSIFFATVLLQAGPTEERQWTSSKGTRMTAVATHVEGGKVAFSTTGGRTFLLELSQLSSSDQTFLRRHFEDDFLPPREKWDGKGVDKSEVQGPVKVSEKASYYYYQPKTIPAGVKVPVLFWIGSGKGHKGSPVRFARAADLTGVVIVTLVEAKGGQRESESSEVMRSHIAAIRECLPHLAQTLPIDLNRVIFSGDTGGGAIAYEATTKFPSIGAITMVSYIPRGTSPNKSLLYYLTGGARDRYRYANAQDKKKLGERATQQFYLGGHTMGRAKNAELGLIWLYTRHILETSGSHSKEYAAYEDRFLTWLKILALTKSNEATYWCDFILNTCSPTAEVREAVQPIYDKLIETSSNSIYLEGRKAIEAFAAKTLVRAGDRSATVEHTSSGLESGTKKLLQRFDATPGITEIIAELGMETQ